MLFLNRNDLDRGYIAAQNRKGARERFPLLSISIVGTSSDRYRPILVLSEILVKHKKMQTKQGPQFLKSD
jgi:hypothetical protein